MPRTHAPAEPESGELLREVTPRPDLPLSDRELAAICRQPRPLTLPAKGPQAPGGAFTDALARTSGGRTSVALSATGVLLDRDSGTATIVDALDPTVAVTVPLHRLRRYWDVGDPAGR